MSKTINIQFSNHKISFMKWYPHAQINVNKVPKTCSDTNL